MSEDHPKDNIIKISQNTEKSPGDLKRLAVTPAPIEDHWSTLVWKTLKGVIKIIIIIMVTIIIIISSCSSSTNGPLDRKWWWYTNPYTWEMTQTDYTYQEKKKKEDLPELRIPDRQRFKNTRIIFRRTKK